MPLPPMPAPCPPLCPPPSPTAGRAERPWFKIKTQRRLLKSRVVTVHRPGECSEVAGRGGGDRAGDGGGSSPSFPLK